MLGQLFIDLDGTIADFDRHHETVFGIRSSKLTDNVDWAKVRESKDFYLNMPPMEDFPELWDFVKAQGPVILTGVPSANKVPEAEANKRAWVAKHLGPHVLVICCPSSQKYAYCKPGDVLVDDWEKYKKRWLKAGGLWVTHTSARETIQALTYIGFVK